MKYREHMKEIVAHVKSRQPCRCDLDNWQPEWITGHSWVCPIHKQAMEIARNGPWPAAEVAAKLNEAEATNG